jgi:hypothetical protein
MWVDAESGLDFVRVSAPNTDEQKWAISLAKAISSGIDAYLGSTIIFNYDVEEIESAALRAFGYAWKYREAPFGEAQWLDEQGGAIRLAGDWLEPIKPILNRYRDASQLIG